MATAESHGHQNPKTFTKSPPLPDFLHTPHQCLLKSLRVLTFKMCLFLFFSDAGTSHPSSPTSNQCPSLSIPVLLYCSQLSFPQLPSVILKHILIRLQVLYFDIHKLTSSHLPTGINNLKSFYESQTYLELPLTLCSSDPAMYICLNLIHACLVSSVVFDSL